MHFKNHLLRSIALALAVIVVPIQASAHPGHAGDGFLARLIHPFTGPHLTALLSAALVVVCIWLVLRALHDRDG